MAYKIIKRPKDFGTSTNQERGVLPSDSGQRGIRMHGHQCQLTWHNKKTN